MSNFNVSALVQKVQQSQQGHQTESLIDGISQQMQQSSNQETKQFGQELQTAKPQLVKACQHS